MSWRLRKPSQAIYGPVELPELCRWAAEGRILPDDEVCENDGAWKLSVEVAELELNWLLPRKDGQAKGPLHILAYAELLQRRILRGDEVITHRATGDKCTVAQAVAPELIRRAEALAAALDAQPQTPPVQPEKDDATGLEKTVQDLTRRYERLLARTREQEDELRTLKHALANTQSTSTEQLAAATAARQKAEKETAEYLKQLTDLKALHEELTRNFRDLNDRYIRLRDQTPGAAQGAGGKPKVRLV